MGEYAKRKSDGQSIKIGTCEKMYYIRFEDRYKVAKDEHSLDCAKHNDLFWRVPIHSEDGIEPGDYENSEQFKDEFACHMHDSKELPSEPIGNVQLKNESLGMLVNVQCYHGTKLPERTESAKFFFNGKRNPFRIAYLKNTKSELRIVFQCIACGKMWSDNYQDIKDLIICEDLKLRLFEQCSLYWQENNEEFCPYTFEYKDSEEDYFQISCIESKGFFLWQLEKNGELLHWCGELALITKELEKLTILKR